MIRKIMNNNKIEKQKIFNETLAHFKKNNI